MLTCSRWVDAHREAVGLRFGEDADSDFDNLYVERSSLEAVAAAAGPGLGVFTRRALAAGAVLCEIRGAVLRGNRTLATLVHGTEAERALARSTIPLRGKTMVTRLLCSKVNDCHQLGGPGGCWPGTDHNTKFVHEPLSGKVFLVAARALKRGEELFVDYGAGYWSVWGSTSQSKRQIT